MLKKIKIYALVSVLCVTIAACSTSWITTAQQYISILTPVVTNVIQILATTGVLAVPQSNLTTLEDKVTNDLGTISTLLGSYSAANATTTEASILAAANDAETNINAILSALNIVNPTTKAEVVGALDLSVTVITELTQLLPSSSGTTLSLHKTTKKVISPSALKKQFNTIFGKKVVN